MADAETFIEMPPAIKLGVGVPGYAIGNVATQALLDVQHCPLVDFLAYREFTVSALTLNHNLVWCWLLNECRAERITHGLILHADVRPQAPHWIELLITQMFRAQADVLGCFIAIKNHLGYTSTAIDTDPWTPQRLTLMQAKRLPLTWTSDVLLINTGLMLVDLRSFAGRPNVPCFGVSDAVMRDEKGNWTCRHEPEDWGFSRQLHSLGYRVFVTRAVGVEHFGIGVYPNNPVWGMSEDTDSVYAKGEILVTDSDGGEIWFRPHSTGPNGSAEASL